jgi:hypothetical protein
MVDAPVIETCHKCGGPLQRGWIKGTTGAALYPATVLWEPEKVGSVPGSFGDDTRLARLPFFRFSPAPEFRARLCPKCKRVEFDFE